MLAMKLQSAEVQLGREPVRNLKNSRFTEQRGPEQDITTFKPGIILLFQLTALIHMTSTYEMMILC